MRQLKVGDRVLAEIGRRGKIETEIKEIACDADGRVRFVKVTQPLPRKFFSPQHGAAAIAHWIYASDAYLLGSCEKPE